LKTVFDDLGRDPTANEIVTYVYYFMVKQGKRSFNEGRCVYRSPEGLACAVGCLIDDETAAAWDAMVEFNPFSEQIQGKGITKLKDQIPDGHWMRDNMYLLMELQVIHDKEKNWEDGSVYSKILDAQNENSI
jgi:hypothetical protein